MSKSVEFFFDYVSLYSYLASSQVESLGASEVIYRPMFLGGVMQATGNRPPGLVPEKGRYLHHDAQRWASRYNIPLVFNPVFPLNTLNALRAAIVSLERDEFSLLHPRMMLAAWSEEANIGEPGVLAEVIASAGLPADEYMEAISDSRIKDALKANTEEAVARGVFGAPTFFVGEEMYFGNDRFEFIREALDA